jgi:signal transduction histidine kinase
MSKLQLTIRGKLSVLYTTILFGLLTGFCVILYSSIAYSLKSKSRSELLTYAHKLSETFDKDSQSFSDLPEGDFNANPLYWFRMIRPDGSLYHPAPVFAVMPETMSIQKIVKSSKVSHWFYDFEDKEQWFSSVVFPINEGYQFSGWVEVVIPVSDEKRILDRIGLLMVVLGSSIVMLLFFSGRFLARKTLAPVEQIRKQVDEIYEKNLSKRIISPNPDDEIGQLAGTFNNLLQRLERAFDSQQQFIADASHELKTPLAILRTQWEKLAGQQELPYNYRVRIQSDIEELARLSNLINNLLLLASPKEKLCLNDLPVINLSELVHTLYDDLLILSGNKQQVIEVSITEDLEVYGDKSQLYQLLLNLADNAVKYTRENGKISIELTKDKNMALFCIADNGIGISPEHLPHIFERFYRVEKSRSRQSGGYGLGLAVSQTIVEAHFGTISISSIPGNGTTIKVNLPLA